MNDHVSSEDLAAYVDGRLSAESRSAVESHIAGCPECLDELAEVTALLDHRQEKIPARFLDQALGEKNKAGRSVLPLRLVFEVAAAVVVVVFIGYLFLANNRFWQAPEQQKPAEMASKDRSREGVSVPVGHSVAVRSEAAKSRKQEEDSTAPKRDRADSVKLGGGLDRALDEKILGERSALKKMEPRTADKNVPASPVATAPFLEKEEKLQAKLEQQPQAAVADEMATQKVATAEPAVSGAVSGTAQEFAADGLAVARAAKGKAALRLPIRVEGEASLSDLRNPELLSAWSWLRQGLVLMLDIDGAGNVIEVVLEGNFAPPDAKLAETEARKLLFSASVKKQRRARVVAER